MNSSPLGKAQNSISAACEAVDALQDRRPGYAEVRRLLGEAFDRLGDVVAGKAAPTRELRARIIYDPEPDMSWLEQDIFADEDPANHEALAVIAEARCPCCGRWDSLAASLWGIDMLVSDESLIGVPHEGDPYAVLRAPHHTTDGAYTADELRGWLERYAPDTGRHYLATVALEVLHEARLELGEAVVRAT